jgi:hypothetical protein
MSLSDKKDIDIMEGHIVYHQVHVKEFIKELKEEEIELRDLGLTYEQGVAVWKRMNEFIDKRAGNDLIDRGQKE